MALHPQVISLLDKMSSANLKPAFTLTPVEARKQMDEMAAVRDSRKTLVGSVEEIDVPGPAGKIVIRIYRPSNQTDKNLPLFIYFHGGGHVIGSLDSHDEVARFFVLAQTVYWHPWIIDWRLSINFLLLLMMHFQQACGFRKMHILLEQIQTI